MHETLLVFPSLALLHLVVAARAGGVEGGAGERPFIRTSGTGALVADKVEAFSARLSGIVGSRIALFDLDATFNGGPAHGGVICVANEVEAFF